MLEEEFEVLESIFPPDEFESGSMDDFDFGRHELMGRTGGEQCSYKDRARRRVHTSAR